MVSELAPSWSRICCVSGQTTWHIESVPGARRFRTLKLDILDIERHYRHVAPSRKIGLFPPIPAGWEPKMLDRRSLLVAGASSLASVMLPRVPGSANAFILPFAPTEAHADEKDPFRVLVLSRTMFGVVVVDVANKNTPITGAQVTLTSRYAAGKQLAATTDDEGTAIFEVAPLSEGYVDEATLLDAYDFNGGISISMAGYRDVEIPLARIQGGTAITAPTRPLSDGEPYFRQLTFDDWDIQYADATFMALPKDDTANEQPDTHAFTVQAHLPQGGQATLHINKVMPATSSSPETVTQIGQVKASAHRARIIWRRSRSKTSSSMQRQTFWGKGASCALSSTTRAKPTRSHPLWPLLPRRRQRRNPDRPLSSPLPWTKRSLRLISRRRFPASAAISSRAGCPRSPFCSISRLPDTCCLAEDTSRSAT